MSARLALVAVLAACGPKSTEQPRIAPPVDAAVPETPAADAAEESKDPLASAVESIVTLYEAIAKLPAGTSCQDAAASIDRLGAERASARTQVRVASQGSQATLVDGLFHDASPRLSAAMTAIDALATRCTSEPAVGAALARLSAEEK